MWRPSRLVAPAIATVLFGSQAFAERPLLSDLRWIHPQADAVAVLTTEPAECLVVPDDPVRARLARLGRVAFRSPALLGGLAARVGISCDSCHRNGHDNPAFHFAGVSGGPGTADVTGSVFSTSREDGLRNPVAIPSLVDSAASPPFGSVVPAPDLSTFLNAAIVDEFQGESPPAVVVDGLRVYLEALRSEACPEIRTQPLTLDSDAREVLATFDVASEWLEREGSPAGEFALRSLRAALERVYQRISRGASARRELVEISRSLARLRARLDELSRSEALRRLAADRKRFDALVRLPGTRAEASFFDPVVLQKALDATP